MSESRRGWGGGWRPGCHLRTGVWGLWGKRQRFSVTSVIQRSDLTCPPTGSDSMLEVMGSH